MTTLAYAAGLPTAGSTLNSVADPELVSAFNSILTWANAGTIDGTNVSAALTGRRKIMEAYWGTGFGVGNNPLFATSAGDNLLSAATSTRSIVWAVLDASNYAITGKANTQLVIRLSVATNAAAPAVNFLGQLNAVTFSGGSGSYVPTIGSQAGTSATVVTPAASSAVVAESSPFAFPATGAYAAVLNFSGALASNSAVAVHWELFVQNN